MRTITLLKKTLLVTSFSITSLFLLGGCGRTSSKSSNASDDLSGTITISGAFALYPITVKWADEFKKLHPNVRFNISAGGAGKGIADALAGLVDIGLASREIHEEEIKKGAYTIYVTKDAVIPTFNDKNPNAEQLFKRGLKKEEFEAIFISNKITDWKQISGLTNGGAIHAYIRSDAAGAADTWASFFGKKQEDLKGIGVFGDPGLVQAVKNDPLAIGFNNTSYLYDLKSRKQVAGIKAVPIDVNGNGKIDADEDFYKTVDELTAAIAEGKYPSPPARNLGFLFKGKPEKKELVEFVKYVLSDGQKFIAENGYIGLSKETIAGELKKLQ